MKIVRRLGRNHNQIRLRKTRGKTGSLTVEPAIPAGLAD
jgi:hypothetical protein